MQMREFPKMGQECKYNSLHLKHRNASFKHRRALEIPLPKSRSFAATIIVVLTENLSFQAQ